MERLTAKVISNDGETAQVLISNGDKVRCYRAESESSREEFLRDFPVGQPIAPDLEVERFTEQVH